MSWKLIFFLVIFFSAAGCDEIRTKMHMMPNQDEQECLNSERLNFKDPDVLFVANLGDRGWKKLKPNTYWVRYKAKNSYGAYMQGNMLCEKVNGKWRRAIGDEYLISLSIANTLLDKEIELMRATRGYKSRFGSTGASASDSSYEAATEILNKSPDSLSKYYALDAQ
ncbi:hypothetical protein RBA41_29575 [Massilia sp. CCM 9210]|uniref:hypothetical protein n=1 Tax=Massilia scottii TaxID=3057166 RepID=UPI002796C7A2|nr:hypothetical protein [Massilia sp. CCM 9210]MDQ1817463.1 hypothetical protein [Massilia sp. CCM 9210]